MADLRETIHIDAPAYVVYDLVADLPRMPEWSPECERISWRGIAIEAVKGANFVGFNKAGASRWMSFGTITAADHGRHLAYKIHAGPLLPISLWEYFIVPDRDGDWCTLAQQWTDLRNAPTKMVLDRILSDRIRRNKRGMRATLAAIKRAAEHH